MMKPNMSDDEVRKHVSKHRGGWPSRRKGTQCSQSQGGQRNPRCPISYVDMCDLMEYIFCHMWNILEYIYISRTYDFCRQYERYAYLIC